MSLFYRQVDMNIVILDCHEILSVLMLVKEDRILCMLLSLEKSPV